MMPGLPNLQSILQQAQQIQVEMAQAQADLALTEVTGHAGGGLVTATVTGDGQLKSLVIDPSVVDPDDVETLADLIIAAVRDAGRAAAEVAQNAMGSVAGGLVPGGPGGFDLSAFGLPPMGALAIDEEDEGDDDEGDESDDEGDDEDEDEPDGDEPDGDERAEDGRRAVPPSGA